MLEDRGLPRPCDEEKFIHEVLQNKGMSYQGTLLHIIQGDKFGVAETRTIIIKMAKENTATSISTKYVIVISERSPTPQARVELEVHVAAQGCILSLFCVADLNRPYMHHELVPRHELVTDISATLRRLRCKIDQLPILNMHGPEARWYGWSEGSVVKITRVLGGYNEAKPYWRHVGRLPS